jgi:hypothetical protein
LQKQSAKKRSCPVLGSPGCAKNWIEEALFARRRDLLSSLDMVFFDTCRWQKLHPV